MTDTAQSRGLRILAADIINVYVSKVLSIEPHPQADKLLICMVETEKNRFR